MTDQDAEHCVLSCYCLQYYGNAYDFARLTATGWILTAIANLALIFLLGWRAKKLRTGVVGGPIKY